MFFIPFKHFKSVYLSLIMLFAFITLNVISSCCANSIKSSGNEFVIHSYPLKLSTQIKRSLSLSVHAIPSYAICSKNLCQDGVFKWHKSKTKSLHVGGIFPMIGGWPGGQSCLPSAIMALNEINLNPTILPGYRLNLNWFNSEVISIFIYIFFYWLKIYFVIV